MDTRLVGAAALSWERAEREKETLLITAPELSFIKSRETLCGKATV